MNDKEKNEGRLETKWAALSRCLRYTFMDRELLVQAFCHASYVNEHPNAGLKDNERLEFLGDAVLDLAVSTLLMKAFDEAPEGDLSKFRAVVVDEAGLYEVALGLGLGEYLLLGRGEDQGSGREKPSILADALEALIGAIYLDGGFDSAMEVIARLFHPMIARVGAQEMVHDFKSLLQEFTQQAWKTLPKYRLVDESGPPHQKIFTVALDLRGKMISQGEGSSKKEAEQNAARQAFLSLKET
jgi:ribonuclease III